MAAPLQLEARLIRSDILCELRQLHIARATLVKDRTATKNRAKAVTHCLLKRLNAQRLKQIKRQIPPSKPKSRREFKPSRTSLAASISSSPSQASPG